MLLKLYDKVRLSLFIIHSTTNVCLDNFLKQKYEKSYYISYTLLFQKKTKLFQFFLFVCSITICLIWK